MYHVITSNMEKPKETKVKNNKKIIIRTSESKDNVERSLNFSFIFKRLFISAKNHRAKRYTKESGHQEEGNKTRFSKNEKGWIIKINKANISTNRIT